jgi:hypothetical protein
VEDALVPGGVDLGAAAGVHHLGDLVGEGDAELGGQQVEQVAARQPGRGEAELLGADPVDGHDRAVEGDHDELVGAVEHRAEGGGALGDAGFEGGVVVPQRVLGLLELEVVADAGQQDGRPQRLGDVVGGPSERPCCSSSSLTRAVTKITGMSRVASWPCRRWMTS